MGVADPGFSKVPFSNVNNKTVMGDNPKPLAEYCKSESGVDKSRLQCYSYLIKKGKQKDKGARVDGSDPSVNEGRAVSYTIEPGMVFRCIVKKGGAIGGSDREKRENFFPGDLEVIPAFSRVVVKVACKGWDKYKEGDIDAFNEEVQTKDVNPCQRGYGCGIVELRMAPGSILSDLGTLASILPGDPEVSNPPSPAGRLHCPAPGPDACACPWRRRCAPGSRASPTTTLPSGRTSRPRACPS